MKCQKCFRDLIDEESIYHVCRGAKGFRIDGETLWLSDGTTEYPLKLDKIKDKLRINRKFTEGTNREFDRTLKQYSYKVMVPYYTVW